MNTTIAPTSVARDKRMLFVITGIVAVSFVGVSLPYPILAPHILGGAIELSLAGAALKPEQTLAIVLAAYPAGMFIGNQILGACADRFGRKRTLFLSVAAAGVGYLWSAAALATDNMASLALSRLATGTFEGNVPIARAIASDLRETIPLSTSFGYIGGAVYAGYLIGPVIGGAFAGHSVAAPF
ncbi:MAG: MFS transporter, partial [Pseudomonadota bacterium]